MKSIDILEYKRGSDDKMEKLSELQSFDVNMFIN